MGIAAAFFIIVPMLALIVFANIAHHMSKSPDVPASRVDVIKLASESAFNDLYAVGSYHPNNIWNGNGRRDD